MLWKAKQSCPEALWLCRTSHTQMTFWRSTAISFPEKRSFSKRVQWWLDRQAQLLEQDYREGQRTWCTWVSFLRIVSGETACIVQHCQNGQREKIISYQYFTYWMHTLQTLTLFQKIVERLVKRNWSMCIWNADGKRLLELMAKIAWTTIPTSEVQIVLQTAIDGIVQKNCKKPWACKLFLCFLLRIILLQKIIILYPLPRASPRTIFVWESFLCLPPAFESLTLGNTACNHYGSYFRKATVICEMQSTQ